MFYFSIKVLITTCLRLRILSTGSIVIQKKIFKWTVKENYCVDGAINFEDSDKNASNKEFPDELNTVIFRFLPINQNKPVNVNYYNSFSGNSSI